MKNNQKGFIVQGIIAVITLLIIGGALYYIVKDSSPFKKSGESRIENIDGQNYQVQDYAPQWGQKGVEATPTSNNQPSITVLSPNGGEIWTTGSVQNIRWNFSSNIGSDVAIFLRPHPFLSSNRAYLITKKIINTGSYSWKVLDTESATGVPETKIPNGKYTLSICVLTTSLCGVSDNYFSITN